MNSPKIVVVQLKEVIMTVIFSILGIILLGLIIYIFIPKDKPTNATVYETENNLYIPGKYTSSIALGDKIVEIEVEVSKNKIVSIELVNLDEEQEIFYPLVKPAMANLSEQIISNQSLETEFDSDSEVTESVLLNAITDALEQAKIE